MCARKLMEVGQSKSEERRKKKKIVDFILGVIYNAYRKFLKYYDNWDRKIKNT